MAIKFCSICAGCYDEFGNNAEPVNSGRCCNQCNEDVVIPIRIFCMAIGINPRNVHVHVESSETGDEPC